MLSAVRFTSSEEPDFASCFSVINHYEPFLSGDDSLAAYTEGLWGSVLLGLGRPGAVGHLTRAVRISDRLRVLFGIDLALRQLAVAAARAGFPAEAAALVGYAEANLHAYPRDSPTLGWHQRAIDDALAGMANRAEQEAVGRTMTRRQVMAMVRRLDAMIDQP